MDLRERLLQAVEDMENKYWGPSADLLREAAAALAAPREPDGWVVEWEWAPGTGHNRELWGRKEYAEDDAAERRMKYPDIEFMVRPVYIGAPAPAETRPRLDSRGTNVEGNTMPDPLDAELRAWTEQGTAALARLDEVIDRDIPDAPAETEARDADQ